MIAHVHAQHRPGPSVQPGRALSAMLPVPAPDDSKCVLASIKRTLDPPAVSGSTDDNKQPLKALLHVDQLHSCCTKAMGPLLSPTAQRDHSVTEFSGMQDA